MSVSVSVRVRANASESVSVRANASESVSVSVSVSESVSVSVSVSASESESVSVSASSFVHAALGGVGGRLVCMFRVTGYLCSTFGFWRWRTVSSDILRWPDAESHTCPHRCTKSPHTELRRGVRVCVCHG